MMKREIRLHCFNRPVKTAEAAASIMALHGVENWQVVASIDARKDGTVVPEVLDALKASGIEDIRPRERLGISRHVRLNWREAVQEGADFLCHMEDDVLLAPDALVFFERNEAIFGERVRFLCPHGCRLDPGQTAYENLDLLRLGDGVPPVWVCWGAYMEISTVAFMLSKWRDDWGHGWDVRVGGVMMNNKFRSVTPLLPRARNTGFGNHRPHKRENVARPVWSGDFQ